jgi:hypothetical protein
VPTTKVRRPILHSITDIMAAAAAGVMDMDKAECSISRILPVRHPRCRENNNRIAELSIADSGDRNVIP